MTIVTIFLIAYACVWAVSGTIVWGLLLADVQGKYPTLAARDRREDIGYAVLLGAIAGLMGPLGVFMALCLTGFGQHGWRLK